MRRILIATTTALIATAGTLAAQDAHAGHGAMHREGAAHGGHACPMMAARAEGPKAALDARQMLGLSAEQVARLEQVHARQHEAHQATMPRMQALHGEIAGLRDAATFDEGAVRAATQRAGEMHAAMMLADLCAQHETRGVLTQEQRDHLARHAAHHGQGGHGEGGHGEGGHGSAGHGHGQGGMGMQCPMMGGGASHGDGAQQHRHDR
jgi:hypothetical protein